MQSGNKEALDTKTRTECVLSGSQHVIKKVTAKNTHLIIPIEKYQIMNVLNIFKAILSYDVASGSEITPCNKIDKPLVVYRLTGNVMTSITTLRT